MVYPTHLIDGPSVWVHYQRWPEVYIDSVSGTVQRDNAWAFRSLFHRPGLKPGMRWK